MDQTRNVPLPFEAWEELVRATVELESERHMDADEAGDKKDAEREAFLRAKAIRWAEIRDHLMRPVFEGERK